MAAKVENEVKTTGLYAVEQLMVRFGTKPYIYSGACSMKGWRNGKMVSEEEYQEAVTVFLRSGMGGKA